jgi:ElaB/YqjD/DUF883 family membrane-anchored ribosome-binding protein
MLLAGIKKLSRQSIARKRTFQALEKLKNPAKQSDPNLEESQPEEASKMSSAEIQTRAEETEDQLQDTLSRLSNRLSPRTLIAGAEHRIRESPYRYGAVAMVTGVLGGLLLTRARRRA